MKKYLVLALSAGLLAACASGVSGNGHNEMYGQISSGVESVHTHTGQ